MIVIHLDRKYSYYRAKNYAIKKKNKKFIIYSKLYIPSLNYL